MKVLINIPKEFEEHFNTDRFEDSLHRLSADAHLLAGNYEQETARMLRQAFQSAEVVYSGKAIWEDTYGDGDLHCSCCGAIIEKGENYKNLYYCYHCGKEMKNPYAMGEINYAT